MEIKNITTLEELFYNWKDAQKNEPEESCKTTFPLNKKGQSPDFQNFKESFCIDGYITDDYNKVLIICRESNVSRNETMGEFNGTFAMKDLENDMTVYYNFIKKALKKLEDLDANYTYTDEDAKKCAYMNLNKRGGYGSTNPKRLANYVKKYNEFIEKEIELLNPDIIICGGTYGTVKKLNISTDITIFDCYHPAYKHENFHKCFKMDNKAKL